MKKKLSVYFFQLLRKKNVDLKKKILLISLISSFFIFWLFLFFVIASFLIVPCRCLKK